MKIKIAFLFCLSVFFVTASADVYKSNAQASFYAEKYHGRKTANGEIFNMYAMTCAHKTLPFGTVLRVTNLKNNKTVDVRVNDRGPFVKGREIDVSKAAAQKLDMIKTGTASVKIEILSAGEKRIGKGASSKKALSAKNVKVSSDFWDVQIGSFSNYDNANKVAQNLLRSGFENVYFQKTPTVTRVVLKKVPDGKLETTEEMLRKNGYADYVVKKTI